MALTEVSNPRKTISTYDSDAVSTTQLLYKYNESALAGKDAYVLEVIIPELDDLTLYFVPKSNGDIIFNLGPAIERAIDPGVTYVEITPSYEGIYRGGSTGPTDSIVILAVVSKRQLLADNGANLYEFILKSTPLPLPLPLSVFSEGRKWLGWGSTLNYLNVDYTAIDWIESDLDINKVLLPPPKTTPTTQPRQGIIGKTISEPAQPGSEYMKVLLQSSSTDISTEYFIKLEPECENPIMITWENSLGGVDYWLFERQQSFTNVAEEGFKFQAPIIGDIENVNSTKRRYAPTDIQFITLKADRLTQNQLQGLHDIKNSSNVRLWLAKNGAAYVQVIVSTGYNDDFTTGKSNYEFSLTIELPDNFDFFKAKQY